MVTSKPAPTFGKRGRPAAVRAAPSPRNVPAVFETSESDVPPSVLAASLMPPALAPESAERRAGAVPTSWRAGLLAGLVVSLMQAGMVIVEAKAQSASLAGLATMTGVSPQDMLLLVVAGSLLDGAQTTGFTVLTAHKALKRLAVTGHAAYALGGAAAAAVYAVGALLLGFGAPAHGWAIALATGLGAGFFYRVFAGAADRARLA
jgi:hypothetical protein